MIAGGGHKFTSRVDPENFSMGVRGEGGVFQGIFSLI